VTERTLPASLFEVRAVEPGVVFARDYRVLRPLSEGGMGSLWVVEQLSTGKLRALKLLHADMTGEDSRRRFEQEARIGARIASEHVDGVIAAGVEDDRPWLVMELLEGEVLADRVDRAGPLPVDVAADVMNQLAHGSPWRTTSRSCTAT
jgi:serine/threonine protein kinase